MTQRVDDARDLGNGLGYGVNSATGALEPLRDGNTALGATGVPASAMRFSDVVSVKKTLQASTGMRLVDKILTEDITLATGAASTDSTADLLPANSLIGLVYAEVLTTVTANATGWSVADATTAARFLANHTGLAAGTVKLCPLHLHPDAASAAAGPVQATAAKIRITCAGGNPGAGKIRITVHCQTLEQAT